MRWLAMSGSCRGWHGPMLGWNRIALYLFPGVDPGWGAFRFAALSLTRALLCLLVGLLEHEAAVG